MKLISVDIARNFGALIKIGKGGRINYDNYYKKAVNGERVHKAFAYGVCKDREADEFIEVLREIGYEVKYKQARMTKNKETGQFEPKIHLTTNNLRIAMDIVKNADKVDTVVLGSNDKELIEVIDWLKHRGIKVHILSLLIPQELKNVADYYEELGDDVIDYK